MRTLTAPDGRSVMLYDSNDPTAAVPPTLINTYSVLSIPAYFRAMVFLSGNLASFPRSVHQGGARLDVKHALDGILRRRPNAYQNATAFWRTLFFHAAHAGNGFARVERGQGLQPVALHNLRPGDVMPFRIDAGDGRGVQQWFYHAPTKDILPGADVVHLAGLGFDGMVGLDPVHLHAEAFQRAATLGKYMTRFLMKGTVIRGAVEVPGAMTGDQMEQFRAVMRTNFRGSGAEEDVIILTDGAKLNNATLSPEQSQLIQQAAFSTKQIAQITGVPPAFLYDLSEGKYNASVEQAGIDVVRYTFRPWIELIEDELTLKLLSPAEQDQGFTVRMDPTALTRGDTASVTSAVVAQTNAGLRTPNEGRAVLELPPDPDPASDKLRALGDTSPKAAPSSPTPPKQSAAVLPGRATFADGPHEFSCVMAPVGGEAAARLLGMGREIPSAELATDGREQDCHVTVLYGLHTSDPEEVRKALAGQPPIRMTLGKTKVFPANENRPDSDVVVADVDSPDLHRLNGILRGLPHTNNYPEYRPHATVAYVKVGEGKKYDGRTDLEGLEVACDCLTFSDPEGRKRAVPLAAKAPGGPPPSSES